MGKLLLAALGLLAVGAGALLPGQFASAGALMQSPALRVVAFRAEIMRPGGMPGTPRAVTPNWASPCSGINEPRTRFASCERAGRTAARLPQR